MQFFPQFLQFRFFGGWLSSSSSQAEFQSGDPYEQLQIFHQSFIAQNGPVGRGPQEIKSPPGAHSGRPVGKPSEDLLKRLEPWYTLTGVSGANLPDEHRVSTDWDCHRVPPSSCKRKIPHAFPPPASSPPPSGLPKPRMGPRPHCAQRFLFPWQGLPRGVGVAGVLLSGQSQVTARLFIWGDLFLPCQSPPGMFQEQIWQFLIEPSKLGQRLSTRQFFMAFLFYFRYQGFLRVFWTHFVSWAANHSNPILIFFGSFQRLKRHA